MEYEEDINGDGMVSRVESDFDMLLRDLFVNEDGSFDVGTANKIKETLNFAATSTDHGRISFSTSFQEQFSLTERDTVTVGNLFDMLRFKHLESLKESGGQEAVDKFNEEFGKTDAGELDADYREMKRRIETTDADDTKAALEDKGYAVDPKKSFREHLGATKQKRTRSGTLASEREYKNRDLRVGFESANQSDGSRIPSPVTPTEPETPPTLSDPKGTSSSTPSANTPTSPKTPSDVLPPKAVINAPPLMPDTVKLSSNPENKVEASTFVKQPINPETPQRKLETPKETKMETGGGYVNGLGIKTDSTNPNESKVPTPKITTESKIMVESKVPTVESNAPTESKVPTPENRTETRETASPVGSTSKPKTPKEDKGGSRKGSPDYGKMILAVRTSARSGPHSESYYGQNGVAARFYGRGVLVDRNRDGKITPQEREEAKAIADSGALDPITFEYDKKEMLDRSLKRQQTLKLNPETYNIGGVLVDVNGDGIVSLIEEEEARKQSLQNNISNVIASRDQDESERFIYGGMTRDQAADRYGEDLVLQKEEKILEGPSGNEYAPVIAKATEGGFDPVTGETTPRDRSASFGGSAYDMPSGTNIPSTEVPDQISSTMTMNFETATQNVSAGGGFVNPDGSIINNSYSDGGVVGFNTSIIENAPSTEPRITPPQRSLEVAPRSPQANPAGSTDLPRRTAGTQLAGLGRAIGSVGGGAGGRTPMGGSTNIPLSSGQFKSVRREMQNLPQWRTVVG